MHRCGHRGTPTETERKSYVDRGIEVCPEWQVSKRSFFDWALANGYREGLQIDRRDNDRGYEPGNSRFVTPKVNMRNRRSTVLDEARVSEIKGALCAGVGGTEIALRFGIGRKLVDRIRQGGIWAEIEPSTLHLVRRWPAKAAASLPGSVR
jgi:hypothetical protein